MTEPMLCSGCGGQTPCPSCEPAYKQPPMLAKFRETFGSEFERLRSETPSALVQSGESRMVRSDDYSLYARLARGRVNYEDFRDAFTQGWVHATADPKRGMRTAEEVGEIYRQLYERTSRN